MSQAIETIRKKQLRFALSIGIPYFAATIIMFLAIYLDKNAVDSISLAGLPLQYWLVAVAVYPITWALFIWYVIKANRMEDKIESEGVK